MTTNFDVATECHYGTISYHSVMPEALDDIFSQGENLSFEMAVDEAKASLRSVLKDWFSDCKYGKERSRLDACLESAWDAISDDWNYQYQGEDEQFLYERDGYKISNSPSLVCLFVEKSPYYTYTRGCSPCVPNAGDLDNAGGSLKTYCLGPEWFDGEKAPYPVHVVATGQYLDSNGVAQPYQ